MKRLKYGMRTSTKKERNQREYHLVTEVLAEVKHTQHGLNWNNTKDRHRVFDNLQYLAKFLDVGRVLLDQLARKDVRPEALGTFAERNLKLGLVRFVPVATKKVADVPEDW